MVDQKPTRDTVGDGPAFRQAALDAGFASVNVELIEEQVQWESAEHLVSMFTGWWDCASRLDAVEPSRREGFMQDAIATLKREHPATIVTTGRNHVLDARK